MENIDIDIRVQWMLIERADRVGAEMVCDTNLELRALAALVSADLAVASPAGFGAREYRLTVAGHGMLAIGKTLGTVLGP